MINSKDSAKLEDLLNDDIQVMYKELLKNKNIRKANEIMASIGIEPEICEEIIQTEYMNYCRNLYIEELKELRYFAGIEPDYSRKDMQEAVQEGYIKCFNMTHNLNRFDFARELRRWTGIEPSKELLKKYGVDWE